MRRQLLLAGLTLLIAVLLPSSAWGQSGCQRLQGSENLTFLGFWTGDVDLVLGNQLLHGVVSYTLTSARPTKGGVVLLGTETATFDFGGGNTFTVQDHFSFSRTPDPTVRSYKAINRVTAGTGRFKDAFGKFTVKGDVQFSTSPWTFTSTMRGAICVESE
ncbi:MAG: hypothetical protein ACE5I7_16540 [Candidatus Binatia bacterium]